MFLPGWLDNTAKRTYFLVLCVFVVLVGLQIELSTWLIRASGASVALKLALAATACTGVVGAGQAAQFLVFAVIAIIRRGQPFSKFPPHVNDADLPPVLVQVPGRNEPLELVRHSIESARALNYPSGKILIQHIDNSDDARCERVAALYASDKRVSVVHRDGVRGFKAGNLNIGMEHAPRDVLAAKNALIVVLNVGDTLARESLRLMASEFVRDASVGFVQSAMVVENPGESIITRVESYIANAMNRFLYGCQNAYGIPMTNGSAVAVRATALREVGGWDAQTLGEDWATGMLIAMKGWRPMWVDYAPTDLRVICGEASPHTLEGQQKQKNRWATASAQLLRLYFREWMTSDLPWNQKVDISLRSLTFPTASLRYVGMLLFPLWLAIPAVARFGYQIAHFPLKLALLSASLQNAFLLFVLSIAAIYVMERRPKDAFWLSVSIPVQVIYHLPIVPHIARGVARGARRVSSVFVVTPKAAESDGLLGLLSRQRLALLTVAWLLVPSAVAIVLRPAGYGRFLSLVLALVGTMVLGIFLVPLWAWLMRVAPFLRFAPAPSAGADGERSLDEPAGKVSPDHIPRPH